MYPQLHKVKVIIPAINYIHCIRDISHAADVLSKRLKQQIERVRSEGVRSRNRTVSSKLRSI